MTFTRTAIPDVIIIDPKVQQLLQLYRWNATILNMAWL